jgi:hypothetical protein
MTIAGHDAGSIVKKYIELRDFLQAEQKDFRARMKVYEDAMEVLEGAAASIMKMTGQTALSTEFGTAFPVTKNRITCNDKEAFLQFVREKQAWQFLTAHIAKEAVEEYMEKFEGQLPPGVSVEGFTEIQFRKS